VNAIADAVEDERPPRNYYVGVQAFALNLVLAFFPPSVVEWLGTLAEDNTTRPKRDVVYDYQK
jgi:hypothetical protein